MQMTGEVGFFILAIAGYFLIKIIAAIVFKAGRVCWFLLRIAGATISALAGGVKAIASLCLEAAVSVAARLSGSPQGKRHPSRSSPLTAKRAEPKETFHGAFGQPTVELPPPRESAGLTRRLGR